MPVEKPHYRYPEGPKNIDESITQPSAEFRSEVAGVLRSIIVFIITYISLVIAAVGLAIACAYAGYWVITKIHVWAALLAGIGLCAMGVMVLYFLFKFVFKSSTVDQSGMTEITAKEHPALFEFIKQVANETQTRLPKKVFLSPGVNAFVFYNSSFWSMFLPVRKNLNIGLGLVNCVTVSEFKAVIAHEFGHFSQKSMKLGSYVYHVNHIIHDMLFNNDDYEETLQSFGNVSNIFLAFASITGAIVSVIQDILGAIYKTINERFMALSRQMEFHADAVAASVSGSAPLARALYRLDFAQACYQNVLNHYGAWVSDGRKGSNLYAHHAIAMENFAAVYRLPLKHGLIQVDAEAVKRHRASRVVVKDQWASHPSTQDREQHLIKLNVVADEVDDSAWTLFSNTAQVQKEFTDELYAKVTFAQAPQPVDGEAFRELVKEETSRFKLPSEYRGFYDDRMLTPFDPEEVLRTPARANELNEILTDTTLSLQNRIQGLQTDIDILERIQHKDSPIKTFDFDGQKHLRSDAPGLVTTLKTELNDANTALEHADKELFRLYHKRSAAAGFPAAALENYKAMFSVVRECNEQSAQINSMIREASQLFGGRLTQGAAIAITSNMKREGDAVKEQIRQMLENAPDALVTEADKTLLQSFVNDNRTYFFNTGFDSEAINLYMNALGVYSGILATRSFREKKRVLGDQLQWLTVSNDVAVAQ